MRRIFALVAAAALAGCAVTPQTLPTQAEVELEKYAGIWHEQARLPNRFQEECVGDVQANYILRANSVITVINQCRIQDGSILEAKGEGRVAKDISPPDPAKLEVRFAPDWLGWVPNVWGDYWIMKIAEDYQYSLVGSPDREFLWVLSRDQQADEAIINQLLDHAKATGFDTQSVMRSGD